MPDVVLVFVTNLKQNAVDGYKVDALNFLVKPVEYPRFREVMDDALRRVRKARGEGVLLRTSEGARRFDVRDIAFLEAHKGRVVVHLAQGEVESSTTMR